MPRVPLLGGAYKSASLIANAQRSVNLYPESNPDTAQAPVNVTHFPRPGLKFLSAPPTPGRARCFYRSNVGAGSNKSIGDLYAIIDQAVYYINPDWQWTQIGSTLTPGSNPAYMADNGSTILTVDGSLFGYQINIPTRVLTQIGDPNFLGGDRVDFCDSFLVVNQPNTPNWYSTDSQSVSFNALAFGTKTAWPDNIVTLIAVERQVWLLGPVKGEVAYNAGTTPFSFQVAQGAVIEHGCVAPYSLARQDVNIYWLSQSPEGARMLMRGGAQSAAVRISNHAIEQEWLTYSRVDDAVGQTFQIEGHAFYQIDFPTADRSWVYDEETKQFFENAYHDGNGVQHRARAGFYAYAYGKNLALDWANGNLYEVDPNTFADGISSAITAPIVCIRSLPHLIGPDDERQTVWRLIADAESGADTIETAPQISLRVSLDRGGSFGNALLQSMGGVGHYDATPTWWSLGMARDFVFELSWTANMKTSLNGAFVLFERSMADTQDD
jgi:hypothetical protein